ncbi:MAG: hypothetical protein JEZ12_27640 [Desulfobacterium sp.]|nr:hypothetical protein [Desulfobacterium sp.]
MLIGISVTSLILGMMVIVFKDFFKIPFLYATILGVLVSMSPVTVPENLGKYLSLVAKGIDILAKGAIPLLILSLGYSINRTRLPNPPVSLESKKRPFPFQGLCREKQRHVRRELPGFRPRQYRSGDCSVERHGRKRERP